MGVWEEMISKKQKIKRGLDRFIQVTYLFEDCLVCSNKASVLHHYVPKAQSLYLRWRKENLIPLCFGCHFAHHSKGDPYIHQTILKRKGFLWADKINIDRRIIFKDTIGNLLEVKERLENL